MDTLLTQPLHSKTNFFFFFENEGNENTPLFLNPQTLEASAGVNFVLGPWLIRLLLLVLAAAVVEVFESAKQTRNIFA